MNKLEQKYDDQCKITHSDIYQLLPYLKKYADQCESVIELGVRSCVASYAFLNSKAKVVYGYDIETQPEVEECKKLAKEFGKDWRYIEADVLKIDLPEADLIFLDTFHSKLQCEQELSLHASKAKKYWIMHDTTTFWERAEPSYQSAANNHVDGQEGLRYAVEPFLEAHPEWRILEKLEFNNGLLVLERIK